MNNQYTGHQAPGFRFCFHVSSIAHRPLFLPTEMKTLPEIQRLLKGESPLSVFNCKSIKDARKAFCEFRYKYDFAYWAAREYSIYDIVDKVKINPLILNNYQFLIIDTIQKRYQNRELGRYIITKSFGKVGVTTCVQAYILWLQIYKSNKNSCSCSYIDGDMYSFQKNIYRYLKREAVYSERDIYISKADRHAFFYACRSSGRFKGKDVGFVHFADLSKWYDRNDEYTDSVISHITSGISKSFDTLIVQEGNIPQEGLLDMQKCQTSNISRIYRLEYLSGFTKNPTFLYNVIRNNAHGSPSPYLHINLDLLPHPVPASCIPL